MFKYNILDIKKLF